MDPLVRSRLVLALEQTARGRPEPAEPVAHAHCGTSGAPWRWPSRVRFEGRLQRVDVLTGDDVARLGTVHQRQDEPRHLVGIRRLAVDASVDSRDHEVVDGAVDVVVERRDALPEGVVVRRLGLDLQQRRPNLPGGVALGRRVEDVVDEFPEARVGVVDRVDAPVDPLAVDAADPVGEPLEEVVQEREHEACLLS